METLIPPPIPTNASKISPVKLPPSNLAKLANHIFKWNRKRVRSKEKEEEEYLPSEEDFDGEDEEETEEEDEDDE